MECKLNTDEKYVWRKNTELKDSRENGLRIAFKGKKIILKEDRYYY